VGDSRLYLVRGSSISRLTHDHSYVSRLVENGVLRAEEAESHPQRHILTAALGAGDNVTPDAPAQPMSLEVLCTDGLWGLLTEDEIQSAVAGKTAAEICDTLVDTAKRRGGPDNITMQVLRVN
jgi:serine/threonine protein phosphatase PrpC